MISRNAMLYRLGVAIGTAGFAVLPIGAPALATPTAPAATQPAALASGRPGTVVSRAGATTFPAAPRLLSPADGSVLTHYPRTTTLLWARLPGAARYRVDVQCLGCRTAGVWTPWAGASATAARYGFTWVGDNHGRWRVTAVNSANRLGATSGWRRFYYQTARNRPLPAPMQLYPASGSVFGHYPRSTTLAWGPVERAAGYLLEIQYCATAGCGTWAAGYPQYRLTGTDYAFDFVGAQPGRWRVTALTASNARGRTSPWWTFRFTQ